MDIYGSCSYSSFYFCSIATSVSLATVGEQMNLFSHSWHFTTLPIRRFRHKSWQSAKLVCSLRKVDAILMLNQDTAACQTTIWRVKWRFSLAWWIFIYNCSNALVIVTYRSLTRSMSWWNRSTCSKLALSVTEKTMRKPSPVLMYCSLIALNSSWPAVSSTAKTRDTKVLLYGGFSLILTRSLKNKNTVTQRFEMDLKHLVRCIFE